MQYVEIDLEHNESAIADPGAMLCMDDSVEMNTIFGDGSQKHSGFLGGLLGAGKRLLSGEGLFMTVFTNRSHNISKLSFAAPYPGKIIPFDLERLGGEMLCQRDAFLCAAKGVAIEIAFQKRILAGFFGGEGFILQKLTGDGLAFIHAGGTILEKTLENEQVLLVDTGCVVALQPSVSFEIEMASSASNVLFGGEGLFLAKLTGPGRVWLQSMPFSRLVAQISSRLVKASSGSD